MKIVHLSTFDAGGGAARTACRLSRGLTDCGIESGMLVNFKSHDDGGIIGPSSWVQKQYYNLKLHLDVLPIRFTPNKPINSFSPSIIPDRTCSRIARFAPDIVHIHWIGCGLMQIESFCRLSGPIVWTLHDSWAFTGGCYLPGDCTRYRQHCGACPVLGSSHEGDLSRWVLARKKKAWNGINLNIVTPSNWLADCARSSSLFQDTGISVIPNGLNLETYKPVNREKAREYFGLPQDKKLILFGAVNSTSDRNKGFQLLLAAIRLLARTGEGDNIELVVFGAPAPSDPPDFGIKAHYLGQLKEDDDLCRLYAAADVFVAPSYQENLSTTVMEALACGTPAVAFNIGGMPDMIEQRKNGYLATPYEPEDLAQGIVWVLEDKERWNALSNHARIKVENEFDIRLVARRYTALYEKLLARL